MAGIHLGRSFGLDMFFDFAFQCPIHVQPLVPIHFLGPVHRLVHIDHRLVHDRRRHGLEISRFHVGHSVKNYE